MLVFSQISYRTESPDWRIVLPTIKMNVPTSVNISKVIAQRHSQRFSLVKPILHTCAWRLVSLILDSVKIITNTNYPSRHKPLSQHHLSFLHQISFVNFLCQVSAVHIHAGPCMDPLFWFIVCLDTDITTFIKLTRNPGHLVCYVFQNFVLCKVILTIICLLHFHKNFRTSSSVSWFEDCIGFIG